MASDAHSAYLESRILGADPVELVRILYRTALDSVRQARTHLAAGDIAARSKSISKAIDAVVELNASLNHQSGGELSRRLGALYEYVQSRLLEANFEQTEEPLTEVAGLLATLLEGWQALGNETAPPSPSPYPDGLIAISGQETGAGRVIASA